VVQIDYLPDIVGALFFCAFKFRKKANKGVVMLNSHYKVEITNIKQHVKDEIFTSRSWNRKKNITGAKKNLHFFLFFSSLATSFSPMTLFAHSLSKIS
jgi:predicted rRNA methylase YqxC with S4 and FtsJ domains